MIITRNQCCRPFYTLLKSNCDLYLLIKLINQMSGCYLSIPDYTTPITSWFILSSAASIPWESFKFLLTYLFNLTSTYRLVVILLALMNGGLISFDIFWTSLILLTRFFYLIAALLDLMRLYQCIM